MNVETWCTVDELAKEYQAWADDYYRRPSGRPTRESRNVADALRVARWISPAQPINTLNGGWLRACQGRMVSEGLARTTINARINRIRRVIKWAVARDRAPASVLVSLQAVEPLKPGRSKAKEPAGVSCVEWETVQATLAFMVEPLRTMIELLWYTGMRPGEVVIMRPIDIEQCEGEHAVWIYRPREHKTQHHGHERVVPLGPQSRKLLQPWLDRRDDPWLFPAAAIERPLWVRPRTEKTWLVGGLRQAVIRACNEAGVARWRPLQLRHSAATRIRRSFGLEAARTVLGHSKASTTEIYAEQDLGEAINAMQLLG